MGDEELALKILEILHKNNKEPISPEDIYKDYKTLLNAIENDRTETVIDKIKKVYYDVRYTQGAYCGESGIRMLTKINDIVENKKDSMVWED